MKSWRSPPSSWAGEKRPATSAVFSRDEARALFALEGEEVYDLFYAAHKVRRHFHGNRVTFCSIVPTKSEPKLSGSRACAGFAAA